MSSSATGSLLTPLAAVVRLGTSVVAGLLLLHAVFVFSQADPTNPLMDLTGDLRRSVGGFTAGLVTAADPRVAETADTVVAALTWLVGGALASWAISRRARRSRATSRS